MKLVINKKDFERIVDALNLASKQSEGTRLEDLYRLTRKKIVRQTK